MATVGRDDEIFFCQGMLDADCDGLLARRKVTKPSDFLFFVQSICSHLHSPVHGQHLSHHLSKDLKVLPDRDHIEVYLLQLLLRSVQDIGGGIQFVSLEAFIGKLDLKRFVIFLECC